MTGQLGVVWEGLLQQDDSREARRLAFKDNGELFAGARNDIQLRVLCEVGFNSDSVDFRYSNSFSARSG